MRILTVDTATRRGMVAAVEDGKIVASAEHDRQTTHAERLFGMVDEVLGAAGWEPSSIELLAVGKGPGSFTGVRVGMAAAKGVGFALKTPMVGVVSLDAMAHAGRRRAGAVPVLALLDAKKGEVFAACYDAAGNLLVGPDHIPRSDVDMWLASAVERSGLTVVGEVVGELALEDIVWVRDGECDLPGPGSTAALAWDVWKTDPTDQLDTLEPLYVRPPDITKPANR